ncbi:MAG: cysteine rich repeat-containing protein [Deltaproteobacteria bacterium]
MKYLDRIVAILGFIISVSASVNAEKGGGGHYTPGEGCILASLYAHEVKLSGQCEYALFDAAAQLERAVATLSYLVNGCGDDLNKYCANVPAGEGRLLDCLDKNEKNVSSRCKQALKDTGLK